MGEWSLNSTDGAELEKIVAEHPEYNKFLRGSAWKNFFTKYQESNWIQKRFIELSRKQYNSKFYTECVYKAQCNDVLWHGVFGGIDLPNLRDNYYKYIIECEKQLEQSHDIIDIDMNGYDEYKFMSDKLLSIVSIKEGGQIFELDLLSKNFNLQNTLTRYEEVYHKNIELKEEDAVKEEVDIDVEVNMDGEIATIHENTLNVDQDISLDYDWYLKKSAIDHIVSADITLEEFAKNHFREFGDFANQPFEVIKSSKKKLFLQRDGGIYDIPKLDVTLEKNYHFKKDSIELELSFDNSSEKYAYLHEWNLHFASLKDVTFNGVALETQEQYSMIEIASDSLIIKDKYLDKTFVFHSSNLSKIFITTLNSISQSEKGVDITNQGISIGFLYKFSKNFNTSITFNIEKREDTII